jgi:hypothetical protein
MRHTLFAAGLMAAIALPTAAFAQWADPGCVASNHNSQVEGTVFGALGGALLGDLAGGRHSHGAGAAIGALGGAVAGNAIAGSRNDPCPPAYAPPHPPPSYGPAYAPAPPPPPPLEDHFSQWIDSLQRRAYADHDAGVLTNRQLRHLTGQLEATRSQTDHLRWRDGGALAPEDHEAIRDHLTGISDELRDLEAQGG